MRIVPPAATRVSADANVVGLDSVPAAPSLPPGATYSAPPGGGADGGGLDGGGDEGGDVGSDGDGPGPSVTTTSSKRALALNVATPTCPLANCVSVAFSWA